MLMLKLFCRNIWRYRGSFFYIILLLVFMLSIFLFSLSISETQISHIQTFFTSVWGADAIIYPRGYDQIKDYNEEEFEKTYARLSFASPQTVQEWLEKQDCIDYCTIRHFCSGFALNTKLSKQKERIQIAAADFGKDTRLIQKIKIMQGQMIQPGFHHLIIHHHLARLLQIKVGSKIYLECSTRYGRTNIQDYEVAGIFKFDAELPQYRNIVYLHKNDFYEVTDRTPEDKEVQKPILIFFKDSEIQQAMSQLIARSQSDPIIQAENMEIYEYLSYKTPMMMIIYQSLKYLILGINCILFFIVMVGIWSICRVSLFARISEMGILLTLGTPPWLLRCIYIGEQLFLYLVACLLSVCINIGIEAYLQWQSFELDSLALVSVFCSSELQIQVNRHVIIPVLFIGLVLVLITSIIFSCSLLRMKITKTFQTA